MADSTTSTSSLTPQERLALSRKALVRHMEHKDDRHASASDDAASDEEDGAYHEGRWSTFKRTARSWWYHHPANVALDVARPLVGKYAKEHPFKLLGVAAGLGAATVLLRPWRLVSIGGLVLAAMKSSDITGMVLSMLKPDPHNSDFSREAE